MQPNLIQDVESFKMLENAAYFQTNFTPGNLKGYERINSYVLEESDSRGHNTFFVLNFLDTSFNSYAAIFITSESLQIALLHVFDFRGLKNRIFFLHFFENQEWHLMLNRSLLIFNTLWKPAPCLKTERQTHLFYK